jgi:membrane protease YdiL (CAAX protease family)
MKHHYPNALQAILLVLRLIGLAAIGVTGYCILNHKLHPEATLTEIDSFVFYTIKITAIFLIYILASKKLKHEKGYSLRQELNVKFNTSSIYALVGVAALILLIEPLEKLIPTTTFLQVYFSTLSKLKVVSLFYIVILSPIANELLFRAIILRGLIKEYKPIYAIILSSVLFAIFHFSLLQIVVSFLLSLFIGFIYWQTRSVFLCILLHIINNGIAYFIILITGEISSFERMISNTPLYLILYLFAAVLLSTSLLQIYKRNELKP